MLELSLRLFFLIVIKTLKINYLNKILKMKKIGYVVMEINK